MRFNRWAVVLLAGVLFSACSEKLPKRSIALSEGEMGCLEGFDDKIEAYFVGTLPPAGIDQLFDCANTSIDKFLVYVGGTERGVYRPDELVEFIETYFLTTTRISPALMQEAMELKRVVFGGTNESLTEGDLRSVQRFLRTIRGEMVRLQPFMPFTLTRLNGMSPDEKDAVLGKFRESAQEFGRFFEETVGSYRFERFERFVEELEKIFESSSGIEGLRWVKEHLYVFRVAKVFANYTSGSEILKDEWKRLFQIGIRWACLGLEVSYFLNRHSDDPFSDSALDSLESLLNEGLNLMEDAIRLRPGRLLTFDEISVLLHDSFREGKVPFLGEHGVSVDVLVGAIRPFVQHFLGGPGGNLLAWDGEERDLGRGDRKLLEGGCTLPPERAGRCLNGISLPSLRFLRSRARLWIESVHLVNRAYRDLGAAPADADPRYPKEDVLRAIRSHSASEVGKEVIEHAVASIVPFRSLYRERSFAIHTDPHSPEPMYSRWQARNFTWIRMLAQFFIGGYAEGERADRIVGIRIPEFRKFDVDFRDLGVALKIFDPRYTDSPEKRTREANLFTSMANGDDTIQLDEACEQFAFLFSLKKLANRVHDEIASVCPVYGLDVMDFPFIDQVCYRREYAARIGDYWTAFPAVLRHFGRLSPSGQAEFLYSLEIAARRGSHDYERMKLRPFEVEDSESYSGILHYVEALMNRFDRNRDGGIDEGEAREVFRVVGREIRSVSGLEGDEANFTVLTYLMKYGTRPSDVQYAAWWARGRPPVRWVSPWDIWSDRSSILRVFALLGSQPPAPGSP